MVVNFRVDHTPLVLTGETREMQENGTSDVERREVLAVRVQSYDMVGKVDHGGDHILRREGNAVPIA